MASADSPSSAIKVFFPTGKIVSSFWQRIHLSTAIWSRNLGLKGK